MIYFYRQFIWQFRVAEGHRSDMKKQKQQK